jgi:pyruvate/2-oxoglutarate dehydrogenase complex dihydrolipoamide acyltransferase (E2) component
VEVYTDKLVADIPSPGKGKIQKINYDVEQTCLVGKPLCEILIEEDNVVDTGNKISHSKSTEDISRTNATETETGNLPSPINIECLATPEYKDNKSKILKKV